MANFEAETARAPSDGDGVEKKKEKEKSAQRHGSVSHRRPQNQSKQDPGV